MGRKIVMTGRNAQYIEHRGVNATPEQDRDIRMEGEEAVYKEYAYGQANQTMDSQGEVGPHEPTSCHSEQKYVMDDTLASDEAMRYWQRLQQKGFVDTDCRLLPETTRKQAMYIAEAFAEKLRLKSKWKPFQDLWSVSNLAQEKWDMQQTGNSPARYKEIDNIFID